jgi:ribosome production factor 1
LDENSKKPNGLHLIHLPDGPTYHFKLSSVMLSTSIPNHARPSLHPAELILNNFTTRLGLRVGRAVASLFPQVPDFKGRRVVTFHNQRDFIFFRHHRYIFDNNDKARLQEIGPRFTLKLKSIQKGTFDTKFGEYEWEHKVDMDTSRRRFFL